MLKTHGQITDTECLISVYRQSKICGFARINFIAAKLNTDSATPLAVLKKLSDSGFVKIENYGLIFLTDYGKSHIQKLYEN